MWVLNICNRRSVDPDIILTMPSHGFFPSRDIVAKHCNGGGKLKHDNVKQWRLQGNITCFLFKTFVVVVIIAKVP